METKVFTGETGTAAELIINGGLVAVPTETVYGLAANGMDDAAVRKIYEVKGRPEVKPLSLMVPGAASIPRYCRDVPQQAFSLAEKFWPGPLTIVLKACEEIPSVVLAGGTTVGLRCPDHPLTLQALREAGVPFAAPSANPSGEPSPKDAETVLQYFAGNIDGVIDGGPCGIGRESTLISLTDKPYRILREGALPTQEIEEALVAGMKIVGITGQSGAGKTTALNVLRRHGALVLDCDAIYHEMLQTDEGLITALAAAFPAAVQGKCVDRKKLGNIVFHDPEELKKLNAVTHTAIEGEVQRRLREHAMNGGLLAAVDAVELISSGLHESCAVIWAVTAPEAQRVERIMQRDSISEAAARNRVKAQKPEQYYIDHCTRVLRNCGTIEAFTELCEKTFMEDIVNG